MIHPEILAAIAIIGPTLISLYWIFICDYNIYHLNTRIAGIGCIMHCPFSFALHIYKAYNINPIIRTKLFKLDVIFIHLHTLLHDIS